MRWLLLFVAVGLGSLVACGDAETTAPEAAGGAGHAADGGGTTSSTTASSSGSGGHAPVQTCDEIGAADCFANADCPAADRCENEGSAKLQVPCCVAGTRGVGKGGAVCTGENDCATSLCVESADDRMRCSSECKRDSDCPASLPRCTAYPFANGRYCFRS